MNLIVKKNEFKHKYVNVNGNNILLNWNDIKMSAPFNLQNKLNSNENTKIEIEKQNEIKITTSNSNVL